MKRLFWITVILCFVSVGAFSQDDRTKVPFVAYWSVGDSYDFKITKTDQTWKNGELDKKKDIKQEYKANFTVIDSTESSYTIKWSQFNDLERTFEIPIPKSLLNKFAKYSLTEVIYKTSEVGEFLEVVNWKEISKMMNSLFDDMIKILGKEKKDRRALKDALKPIRKAYSSKEGIEQLILTDMQLVHSPMGVEYDLTEDISYEIALENFFVDKSIRQNVELTFTEVDFDNSFCVLKQKTTLNTDDTKEAIKTLFKDMKLTDKELEDVINNSVLEINEDNTFEYYYNPGVPHRIEMVKEILMKLEETDTKRVQKTLIELVYKE